ncbi:hypothetical protein EV363DRAFT_144341 [Boletus edulis]|nr:hypothetical protein EV363DRAFT_144341 [Boletus edulis]
MYAAKFTVFYVIAALAALGQSSIASLTITFSNGSFLASASPVPVAGPEAEARAARVGAIDVVAVSNFHSCMITTRIDWRYEARASSYGMQKMGRVPLISFIYPHDCVSFLFPDPWLETRHTIFGDNGVVFIVHSIFFFHDLTSSRSSSIVMSDAHFFFLPSLIWLYPWMIDCVSIFVGYGCYTFSPEA